MKVAICTPVHGDTKARFTASLASLIIHSANRPITYNDAPATVTISHHMLIGVSNIAETRRRLAEAALETEPAYLLWLDADHVFPSDTLFRLALHNLPIVGCNYPRRTGEPASTAGRDGAPITPKSEGIEPVDALGFGVCLVKSEVFQMLPTPWFNTAHEDSYFCEQARAHGIQPYVDHSLSMEVGHIAETVLTFPR